MTRSLRVCPRLLVLLLGLTQHLAACWGHLASRTLNHDALEALCSSAELVARRRRLRHARFIRAILTIVRAWHREQQLF